MGMHEITERTTVTEPDGSEKVLLPGRITDTEAELYGLATVPVADVETIHEPPVTKKAAKKA